MTVPLVYVGGSTSGAEKIRAMYAQSFLWPAGTYEATVTGDDAGTATFAFGGLWFRVYLAQSTNTGASALDALELMAAVQSALGSSWELALGTDGLARITNAGVTSATITWGTSQSVADTLGFTAPGVSLAAGATLVAPYPPKGVMYSVSLASTDWTEAPTDTAYALTADGLVYGWRGANSLLTKTVTLGFHPRVWSERVELGSPYTPMFPADTDYNRRRGVATLFNCAQPWTVVEFLRTSHALPIAVVFSNFERFGLGDVYEIVFQSPESIMQSKAISPPIANYRQRSQRAGFEAVLYRAYELA